METLRDARALAGFRAAFASFPAQLANQTVTACNACGPPCRPVGHVAKPSSGAERPIRVNGPTGRGVDTFAT